MASAPTPSAAMRKIMTAPREVVGRLKQVRGRAQSLQKQPTMRNLLVAVLLSAVAVAAPAQQEAKNPALEQAPKSAAGGRAANLPDFTALMKEQGPAVVNVITKREAKTARNEPRG